MKKKPAGLYPIRAASRLSRLSVDTLRAWERRYSAVVPQRKNGVRLYTPADIERLSMLREALDQGHSIGQAAMLSAADLRELISAKPAGQNSQQLGESQGQPIEAIVAALENFSYTAADHELSIQACILTPRELVHHLALPLMRLVGERWDNQRIHVAQEHMLTQLLSNLLGGLIRVFSTDNPPVTILMATLSNDHHSFGLLAAAMLAAGAGIGVIHLGPNLPPEEIAYAAKRSLARVVLISVTGTPDEAELSRQLELITGRIPADTELWLAVNPPELAAQVNVKRKRFFVLKDFRELEQQLVRIGGRF